MRYLEPLYTLRQATDMIPMPSLSALYSYLERRANLFPPRYRRIRRGYVRLLLLSELHRIRADVVKPVRKRSSQASRTSK